MSRKIFDAITFCLQFRQVDESSMNCRFLRLSQWNEFDICIPPDIKLRANVKLKSSTRIHNVASGSLIVTFVRVVCTDGMRMSESNHYSGFSMGREAAKRTLPRRKYFWTLKSWHACAGRTFLSKNRAGFLELCATLHLVLPDS